MNISPIIPDPRIVYGARCSWWDSIHKVGRTPPRNGKTLPACPHCGGVLFEVDNEQEWFAGVDRYEAAGHPGYRKMIEWARGKCFKTHAEAKVAYTLATGIIVP